MKITTFDPIILTKNVDSVVKIFEDLGFEKTHAPVTDTGRGVVSGFRMKNKDGFHVDVSETTKDITRDEMIIRMNVDDFDEARRILENNGFVDSRGEDLGPLETKSAKSTAMKSPSGFTIAIVEHIKE